MNTQIPGTKLTVIIRDDAPLIHCGDTPSYRRVTLDLTQDQMDAIRVKATANSMGKEIFESVSKAFIE